MIARPGNTVVDTVAVGTEPLGIAVTPDGTHVYVANAGDNTVSVINTATNMVAGLPIPVGNGPNWVAFTPDGTHVYVTNSGAYRRSASDLSVIRTATKMVVKTILFGVFPLAGVAVSPDGTHVYVADDDSNSVLVIARPGNAVVATIPVGNFPIGVAIGP